MILDLQHRMVIGFLLFILLPILIVGRVSYYTSANTLKENISQQILQTLKALDMNLSASLSEIHTFSDTMVDSEDIQAILKAKPTNAPELYNYRLNITSLMYSNPMVEDLILYNNKGTVFQLKRTLVPSFQQLQESSFFQEMVREKGRAVWLSAAEHDSFVPLEKFVLTQGRMIHDYNTLENIGYAILHIKLNLFDEIYAQLHQSDSEEELIIDRAGNILYSFDHQWIGKQLQINGLEEMISGKQGHLMDTWEGKKSLITFYPSESKELAKLDWILVSIKPWSTLTNQIEFIRNTTLAIVMVGILMALLYKLLYVKKIMDFISELLEKMKRAEQGDLAIRMPVSGYLEFRKLALGFNRMIEQIGLLLQQVKDEQERKREAEFQVLQQQINPHFLYNTLESINAMAALNGQKEISKMTINLGKLLRISINGAYEVKVSAEIRHVISYLEIQKIRFNNRFQYEIDVEDGLRDRPVLKLILQPLVENILYHAFDQHQENGRIAIKGCLEGEKGCFYIRDNGKGMSHEALIQWNDQHGSEDRHKHSGHGLRNVHDRLKLYYGNAYGLMICSGEVTGTIIKITFPIDKGDSHAV
ncbi:sensor histidine kinase [Ammoniphilus sp. YIM 78166]|uniref:cache domain-containing sensor histidine kinase n=1 Tax=Ammoniphilus sp. YIM 78166 TaxID=1644106 RepID=UPI00106FF23F|nr:sensor histidine kinase [Ammoniphilus sp. YIM 78166]